MSRDQPTREGSKLSFSNDWSVVLAGPPVLTIDTHLWTIEPTGPTLAQAATANVVVSDVTFGTLYRLKEHVVFDDGQEDERTILLTPVR